MTFNCSKTTLILLNILYVMIAFLLIGVATYGQTSNVLTSLPIVGGIVASGVFLLFIAVAGLYGAMKHHQVLLFIYMVVLFGIFIIQFSVSCACLAIKDEDQIYIAKIGWDKADDALKVNVEKYFKCCGFKDTNEGVKCEEEVDVCKAGRNSTTCITCQDRIKDKIGYAFSASGGVGLFFSFTEFIAILFAYKFRKDLVNYVA